jgi:tetratricopeptide (TPR) repeat protein
MASLKDNEQNPHSPKLEEAKRAIEAGDHTVGLILAGEVLNESFDDPLALYLAGQALYKSGRYGLAYNIFRRSAQLNPSRHEPWNMQGVCAEQTWKLDEAEKLFKESLKKGPNNYPAIENLALVEINRCRPDEALKWCALGEKLGNNTYESKDNKAMALLMKKDWSGWGPYRETSGHTKQRPLRAYNDPEEPMWNGEPGPVVVYSNQGIGDEIAFSSCVPDACEKADIILDCDERMVGLFRRSFPKAKVYGTRFKDSRDWDHQIDYSIPIDCLPGLFRLKDEDFPGTAYLKADPERRLQWRALFDTYKKPVIGVAWSGGIAHTGSRKRSLTLDQLLPIFKSIDATWVSLEYKDRRQQIEEFQMETGVEIKDFPRVVHAVDYDETAAMVAELDLVISVCTSVVHLSGALGKECFCIAPNKPRWWYGLEGDLPWYKSVKMFRQAKDGRWPIEEITTRLRNGSQHLLRTEG